MIKFIIIDFDRPIIPRIIHYFGQFKLLFNKKLGGLKYGKRNY